MKSTVSLKSNNLAFSSDRKANKIIQIKGLIFIDYVLFILKNMISLEYFPIFSLPEQQDLSQGLYEKYIKAISHNKEVKHNIYQKFYFFFFKKLL